MLATEQLTHLSPQIQENLNSLNISDHTKVTIKCSCGKETTTSTRNLYRKWKNRPYKCKSCDVKTYSANPDRIEKFRKSFKTTTSKPEVKAKLSAAGKSAWNPERKQQASEILRERNKTDQRIIEGRKKALKVFMDTIGHEHLARIRENQNGITSTPEKVFAGLLRQYKIEFVQHYHIGYYEFDFYIKDYNLLIEIQGEYWHKNTVAKDSAKATYASKLGYVVKHIWEHEFSQMGKLESIIKSWFGKKVTQIDFDFLNTSIRIIDNNESRVFYGLYHYLPAISKSGFHVGCYLGDQLIGCCSFSGVSRKEIAERIGTNKVRELFRFCIAEQYHKKNFATWFLSRAIKIFKTHYPEITHLVAFADTSLHVGTIYKANNWIEDGKTAPNYMYRSHDGYLAHKRQVWDRAIKLSMSEKEYATQFGYTKVWSPPKNRYVLSLSK